MRSRRRTCFCRSTSIGDACRACGGKLKPLGEDVTEELGYVPGRFVVNRIVRPRLACSCCEAICQAPLPSRPIERRSPGPGLLAHVLVSKYGDHLPLYRQSQIFTREGIELDRSTLADWVGKATALLEPLADAIGRYVLGGRAIFADDTPIKLQAQGEDRTRTARIWTYVRDERPWLGPGPPAACYRFSVDRKGEHPASHLQGYQGWMHADGYGGFNELFRSSGVQEVACMAHIRRKFVDVFQAEGSLIAEEALKRIAGLYAVEKEGRGRPPAERLRLRQAGRSRSSMTWRPGCRRSCPGSPASPSWPRRSATPSSACESCGPTSSMAAWRRTTMALKEP